MTACVWDAPIWKCTLLLLPSPQSGWKCWNCPRVTLKNYCKRRDRDSCQNDMSRSGREDRIWEHRERIKRASDKVRMRVIIAEHLAGESAAQRPCARGGTASRAVVRRCCRTDTGAASGHKLVTSGKRFNATVGRTAGGPSPASLSAAVAASDRTFYPPPGQLLPP